MNQSKYIYLLAGPSGSGKSSVARKITEWYGFKEVCRIPNARLDTLESRVTSS